MSTPQLQTVTRKHFKRIRSIKEFLQNWSQALTISMSNKVKQNLQSVRKKNVKRIQTRKKVAA